MGKGRNYLGQLRIYSLVDLTLLLVASNIVGQKLVGAVLLWVGFLAYLEHKHQHSYRNNISWSVPVILFVLGTFYFGWFGVLFIIFSALYCRKDEKGWGLASPFMRGLQTVSLLWGSPDLIWISVSSVAIVARNILGDARDTSKDKAAGMMTWPVLANFTDYKYLHLAGVFATTMLWWSQAELNVGWLLVALVVEFATYRLTPR